MSLAIDFLKEYLTDTGTSQADYAKAAGIDPSLFSQIKNGDVAISAKNLPKLMRGIRTESARLDFLSKHLDDQIPADLKDDISIHLTKPTGQIGIVMEDPPSKPLEAQMAHAFAALPSDMYKKRVIRFLTHLRKDASLRDMFTRTVAYLEEDDSK